MGSASQSGVTNDGVSLWTCSCLNTKNRKGGKLFPTGFVVMGEKMSTTITDDSKRSFFNRDKCPAYFCSIYDRVQVTKRDIKRLAKHFGVSVERATLRFTKKWGNEQILRRKKDPIFGKACQFLDPETRRCTIYHARPLICREFPLTRRCA